MRLIYTLLVLTLPFFFLFFFFQVDENATFFLLRKSDRQRWKVWMQMKLKLTERNCSSDD